MKKTTSGFTIVELLIVIVVIGILAAIVIVAYNGVQDRANKTKENTDLTTLQKAIIAARSVTGTPLKDITNNTYTWGTCVGKTAPLPDTDTCWTVYRNTLAKIAAAIGPNTNLTSLNAGNPRSNLPYKIDENESENMASNNGCNKDSISGTYYTFAVPLSRADCP
jgi:prepilin-type N-terminal cleavage/methylation domain-containing protein